MKNACVAFAVLTALLLFLTSRTANASEWDPPQYWTCKIHFVWQAQFKRETKSKPYVNENSGIPGDSNTNALGEYYRMLITYLSTRDLAGSKSRTYYGMVGDCWQGGKPPAPQGWPKAFQW
jgi:hypothetical protein